MRRLLFRKMQLNQEYNWYSNCLVENFDSLPILEFLSKKRFLCENSYLETSTEYNILIQMLHSTELLAYYVLQITLLPRLVPK